MNRLGEEAYTPDDVAKILKIAKNTVYELIKRGELEAYRVGNKVRVDPSALERYKQRMSSTNKINNEPIHPSSSTTVLEEGSSVLRLAGSHDFLVEHLTQYVSRVTSLFSLHSTYIGSLEGLMMVHRGLADIGAIHLLDPLTGDYNLPYIQRLFIHEPISIIRLATRNQGLIVAKGNPQSIEGWKDLKRRDVRFINRQKGSGTRFLLDAHLAQEGIVPEQVQGYDQEEWSHLATAACVARGSADVTLGIETAAKKLGLSFIPLAQEVFELVFKWTEANKESLNSLHELICSHQFKESLKEVEEYDYSQIGEIIYEIK